MINKTIAASMVLFAFLIWHVSKEEPRLPKPTGINPIGITTYHLIDHARKEIHVQGLDTHRELMITLWYPAARTHDTPVVPYINSLSLSKIKEDLHNHFHVSLDELSVLDTVKTHAHSDAPLSPENASYPVLIFSPGFGMPVYFYTSLLEELASHGYIVVAISYPYITGEVNFPEGRIIHAMNFQELQKLWNLSSEDEVARREQDLWVNDIAFVLKELGTINHHDPHNLFTNKLDLERLGFFGHSFGGGASINACRFMPQCKAAVNIDGRPLGPQAAKGFNTPVMIVRNPFHKKEKEALLRELWQAMTTPSYYVIIKDALHGSFTDLFLFIPWKADPPLKLDPVRGITITRALLVDFFDTYLKGKDGGFEKLKVGYPEIEMENNRIP